MKKCIACHKSENIVKFRTTYKKCNKCIYETRKDYLKAYSISYYDKHKKKHKAPIKKNNLLSLSLSFDIIF